MTFDDTAGAAWARMCIHLNLLDLPAAMVATQEALALAELNIQEDGEAAGFSAMIVPVAQMPVGWVYFDPAQDLALISEDVFNVHVDGGSMFRFCVQGGGPPRFAHYDVQSWRLHDELTSLTMGLNPEY